ncbi:MAG: hypothetical protein A2Y93_15450 [Chloroflexi bacterium RBG_13_68_17]|nr:MAG: hypothetical protein A2Y93_15450 [Chloroflexi bacterium RBG_13_68_17]
MRDKIWARVLRIIGIVLLSLTAVFTLMGGAGTSCVALNPTGYEGKFDGIAPFQWLYILFVIVTLAIGAMGVRAAVLLIRGAKNAYRHSLVALSAGAAVGIIHIAASRILRGGSMPVDMVVYTTIVTLIVFLLFRIPGVWQGVDFEKPEGGKGTGRHAAAIALAFCGVLTLTIQFLMAPTHTMVGVNYADVWHSTMNVVGAALILAGAGLLVHREGRMRLATALPLADPVK